MTCKYFNTISNWLAVVGAFSFLSIGFGCKQPEKPVEEVVDLREYQYGICTDSLDVTHYVMKPGDNPATIFARLGFTPAQADSISQCAAGVLDPTKLKAGMEFCTITTPDSMATIKYIVFPKSLTDFVVINLSEELPAAYPYTKEITYKRKFVSGTINSSLWNTMKEVGSDPLLAIKLSDVYAWQIDFFDVKEGDSFSAIYNEAYIDDTTALNISSIEAAAFTHQGKTYKAIPFMQDSIQEYYDEEGKSLRKAFLKAPLDFFRITSKYTNARFHPILKRYRAHHGIDYAAPTGTPVKSIGAGVVIAKGFQGGGGNFIKIRHNSAYSTTYMHLSKFARGIRIGSTVQQGEVIAYVGSTGLSTGPHLDFRVYKNGQPINPLHVEAPPSKPVNPELKDSFLLVRNALLHEIDSCSRLQTTSSNRTIALIHSNTNLK